MNPRQITDFLPRVWRGNMLRPPHGRRNTYFQGPPGAGKSDLVRESARIFFDDPQTKLLAAKLGLVTEPVLWDLRLAQYEAVELRGVPGLRCKTCSRPVQRCECNGNADVRTSWFPADELPPPGTWGVLFLDELPQCSTLVQNAILQLTRDYRLGPYVLPDYISIVAAGNRAGDRAGAGRLTTALADRFHPWIDFDVDAACWQAHALRCNILPIIRAFVRFDPVSLCNFNPQSPDPVQATPRAWFALSDLMSDLDGAPDGLLAPTILGTVGKDAGGKFLAYRDVWSRVPDIDDVLADPANIRVPGLEEPALLYAIVASLSAQAQSRSYSGSQLEPLVQFAGRIPEAFAAFLIVDLTAVAPDFADTTQASAWIMAHPELMLAAGGGL